jgi:hypothetical protein
MQSQPLGAFLNESIIISLQMPIKHSSIKIIDYLFIYLFYLIHGKPSNRKVETSVKKVRRSDGATQGSKLPLTRLPKKMND